MKIRILQHTPVRLGLVPGDEIIVRARTPAIDALLHSRSLDGERVAEIVDGDAEDEVATVEAIGETATKPRGNRGRSTSVPV